LASLSEDMWRLDALFAPYPHRTSPTIRAVLTAKLTAEPTCWRYLTDRDGRLTRDFYPRKRRYDGEKWTAADVGGPMAGTDASSVCSGFDSLAAHQLLPRSIPVFLDLATCFAGRLFSHVSVLVSPPCSDGNSDGNAGVLDGYNARWRTNSWMIACEEMASRCGK